MLLKWQQQLIMSEQKAAVAQIVIVHLEQLSSKHHLRQTFRERLVSVQAAAQH